MTAYPEPLVQRCGSCAADRTFAPVECWDGHGTDCPELGCVECGLAAVLPGADTSTAARSVRAA